MRTTMRQYMKRWELKNKAKDKLAGKYSEGILLTLTYGVFLIAESVMTTILMYSFTDNSSLLKNMLLNRVSTNGYLFSLGFSLIAGILTSALGVGVSLFYLKIACGQPFSIRDLFCAFRENTNKYLSIASLQILIHFICMVPAYLCNYFYLVEATTQWALLFYICQLVGNLVAYPLILGLSQCYRLLLDYPTLSVRKTIAGSFRLMKGHKMRLFLLTLSFLPLELAAVFTCGIGYLWLSPYMNMTYTLFYLDLMHSE